MAASILSKKVRVLQMLKDQGVKTEKDLQNLEWEKLLEIPRIRIDDLLLIKELKGKAGKGQLYNFLMNDEEAPKRVPKKKDDNQLQIEDMSKDEPQTDAAAIVNDDEEILPVPQGNPFEDMEGEENGEEQPIENAQITSEPVWQS